MNEVDPIQRVSLTPHLVSATEATSDDEPRKEEEPERHPPSDTLELSSLPADNVEGIEIRIESEDGLDIAV